MATLAFGGAASAATLGVTTQPSGSMNPSCSFGASVVVGQATSDPSTPYQPPAPGRITDWQTRVTGATPGQAITLVVGRFTGGSYMVTAVDSRAVPNPLPAGGVASFHIATPITVAGGETLGLYSGSSPYPCYWNSGSTPAGDRLFVATAAVAPAAGQTLPLAGPGESPGGYTLNVAATFVPDPIDVGVTTGSAPDRASAHSLMLLSSTVTNHSTPAVPITFTDQVPSGLSIESAVIGNGTCGVAGQQVTCTVPSLPGGQSVPVVVAVTPRRAGSYRNVVSVAPGGGLTDATAANNTASMTIPVGAALVVAKCVIPRLGGIPLAFSRGVLRSLGCRVGKVRKVHSRRVRRGLVTGTSPGPGTYAAGRAVGIQVSSGPPPRRHRGKPRKRH